MSRAFTKITFTPAVEELQQRNGSRNSYARVAASADEADLFGDAERAFITARDGFYLATVNADGWPYVQFRGGEPGFVSVPDRESLIWTELRGNRQFLSQGNLITNDRVMLFFMDYARQQRLKVWGHARLLGSEMRVHMKAYDWNCPQHIPPRFTEQEWEALQDARSLG